MASKQCPSAPKQPHIATSNVSDPNPKKMDENSRDTRVNLDKVLSEGKVPTKGVILKYPISKKYHQNFLETLDQIHQKWIR